MEKRKRRLDKVKKVKTQKILEKKIEINTTENEFS